MSHCLTNSHIVFGSVMLCVAVYWKGYRLLNVAAAIILVVLCSAVTVNLPIKELFAVLFFRIVQLLFTSCRFKNCCTKLLSIVSAVFL